MHLIEYGCPVCDHLSPAPMKRFEPGDAGIWCCPNCDSAFRLKILFSIISPQEIEDAVERQIPLRIGTNLENTRVRAEQPVAFGCEASQRDTRR